MVGINNVDHVIVYKDPDLAHACNQVRVLFVLQIY